MRLYLSSFRMGNCPERLVALAGGGHRAAVIANAMDAAPADVRVAGVERELSALADVGFRAEELDLREYFDDPAALAPDLERFDVLWLRGGNVFMLRHALARSGADSHVIRLLGDDALVYGGYSAGPCNLAPSLRGLEAVDDPQPVRDIYRAEPTWDGLGVLPYAIVPHVDSPGHRESEELNKVAALYQAEGVPHRTLSDGEVLIIDGDTTTVCG
jgi:dipeptidase E